MCIYKHLESLPDTSSQIFDWKPCQTLFLSLWPEQDSAPNKRDEWTTARLSLAERWTITEIKFDNQILCWLSPCSQMSFRYNV